MLSRFRSFVHKSRFISSEIQSVVLVETESHGCLMLGCVDSYDHLIVSKLDAFGRELGNYAEYSGAPKEDEVLQYARVVIDCATANPEGHKRALVMGGGIANFIDVAATFDQRHNSSSEGEDQEQKLKEANMNIYVRRGGPNYQRSLANMRALGDEIGMPIEVYGPEASLLLLIYLGQCLYLANGYFPALE